ncbi:Gfo/Idh/MocA family protein [Candidatus Latescibacterota bacterium]
MKTRRVFVKQSTQLGIAGILSTFKAPAFARDMKMVKIGQLGLGSHNFTSQFKSPAAKYKSTIKCRPYAVWDDVPGLAEKMKERMGFEKAVKDPVELVNEADVVHVEHVDNRKVLELARPALEAGKPVFINRPFTASVADAEEVVRLARAHNAPLMSASSLEFQPEVSEINKFAEEKGPVRSYMAYCPEPFFTWMFPHVINYAHAALGGGIESAYFSGDFILKMGDISYTNGKFVDPERPYGSAVSILKYKSRNGEPPIIGMNHIGQPPGTYNIYVYAYEESRNFVSGSHKNLTNIFEYMLMTINDFYVNRKPPRPYEAILEQHRALVATNLSRLSGKAVKLDSLKGRDALPYHDSFKEHVMRSFVP